MLAIKGIYDGKTVKTDVKIKTTRKYNVVITFLEELNEPLADYGLRDFSAQQTGLDFWENQAEDLYQEYLLN